MKWSTSRGPLRAVSRASRFSLMCDWVKSWARTLPMPRRLSHEAVCESWARLASRAEHVAVCWAAAGWASSRARRRPEIQICWVDVQRLERDIVVFLGVSDTHADGFYELCFMLLLGI